MPDTEKIAVLGGGISGLTVALYLKKYGADVTLFEKEPRLGGVIQSEVRHGTVMDLGPNSIRDKQGDIAELARLAGVEEEIIYIDESWKTRFVVRDKHLVALKPNPLSFLFSPVLSPKGKWEMLTEVFKEKGTRADESIASFLNRRIGVEATEQLADPFFSGIYAGDLNKMSAAYLLKNIFCYEREYGSVTKGFLKESRRNKKTKNKKSSGVLTFRKGVGQLTDAMGLFLKENIIRAEVDALHIEGSTITIGYGGKTERFSQAISCLPANKLSEIFPKKSVAAALQEIVYVPMVNHYMIFDSSAFSVPPKGFGFLIPRNEGMRLLGGIWRSSIFPELAPEGSVVINLFAGGRHDMSVLSETDERLHRILYSEAAGLMNIKDEPREKFTKRWPAAIPQFEVGYSEIMNTLSDYETAFPGFIFGGNYRWGVSVPDCVGAAKQCAEAVFSKMKTSSQNLHKP